MENYEETKLAEEEKLEETIEIIEKQIESTEDTLKNLYKTVTNKYTHGNLTVAKIKN